MFIEQPAKWLRWLYPKAIWRMDKKDHSVYLTFDDGPSENTDKVLVNGAGGGIGTILVQLLKSIGADVTAVDKIEKHQMLRSIGANRTIDYRETDYTKENIEYDYVITCSMII